MPTLATRVHKYCDIKMTPSWKQIALGATLIGVVSVVGYLALASPSTYAKPVEAKKKQGSPLYSGQVSSIS